MGSALTLIFTDKLQEDEPARTFSSLRVRMLSGGWEGGGVVRVVLLCSNKV